MLLAWKFYSVLTSDCGFTGSMRKDGVAENKIFEIAPLIWLVFCRYTDESARTFDIAPRICADKCEKNFKILKKIRIKLFTFLLF